MGSNDRSAAGPTSSMLIVHVYVHVLPAWVEEFREATIANARRSLEEPGVVRFDVLQPEDRPNHFVLVEVFRTNSDSAAHKETDHYRIWRDAVEPMMAEPRSSLRYTNVFPHAEGW